MADRHIAMAKWRVLSHRSAIRQQPSAISHQPLALIAVRATGFAGDRSALRAGPAGAVRRDRRPAERLGRLRQRRRSRRVRRLPRPPESPLSPGSRPLRGRRGGSRPGRQRGNARRRVGRLRRATATSISTSASSTARRTSSIATTATAVISPTSPPRSASTSRESRARCRGSTTTTTAISICSSPSATSRTGCFATMAAASRTSPPSRASAIRARQSAPCGSTSTATAISDLFVANQNGDTNGLFRNDRGRFVDVAREWGVEAPRRSEEFGGVGAGRRGFRRRRPVRSVRRELRAERAVPERRRPAVRRRHAGGRAAVRAACDDAVVGRLRQRRPARSLRRRLPRQRHALSRSPVPQRRRVRAPAVRGGAACARQRARRQPRRAVGGLRRGWRTRSRAREQRSRPAGTTCSGTCCRRRQARQSMAIDVVDARGRHTRPGAEVRVYAAGTRRLISSGLVDTGGGYCSQNVMPVHLGTGSADKVDIEVTTMSARGRRTTKRPGVKPETASRPFVVRVP